VEDAEYWAEIYSGSIRPGDNAMEPVSDILYPILNEIDRIQLFTTSNNNNDTYDSNRSNNNTDTITQSTTGQNNTNHPVVAVMAATFYWRDVMKNTLPSGKQGLIVVIENPCMVSFTYQIK
jgi:hypothetical protein